MSARTTELRNRADAVAAVAAIHADAVDREGRFPAEALEEARRQRLLGMAIPHELGGDGASLAEVVDVCFTLGRACASTAMIFAMHQIKMGCVVRHHGGQKALADILQRVAAGQLLLASSTTEGQGGGNVRASAAAITRDGESIELERVASVISYGRMADGVVTTARRSADAPASDQVLVVFLKEHYTLEPLQGWDTLGMRGTCSEGFNLKARASAGSIVADPYDKIHAQTMVPYAHLCWGSVWAGIASSATARAQAFVRAAARQAAGQMPPAAAHFTQAVVSLRTLRSLLAGSLASYERAMGDDRALAALEFQSLITLTKVQASELAVATVTSAMRACGLSGYRNDGPFSIGRQLRDVLSSPIMINNDRILSNLASSALLTPLPAAIGE